MFQSLWSRLHRRRMMLLARDIFDADLDRARHKPGCTLCRLVKEHDQQVMHSFLWEYCTDPHVGMQISASWGFCPYHTWSLAVLEHARLGDGLGITISYQVLLKQLQRFLQTERYEKHRISHRELPAGPAIGSAACRFCQLARREESLFLSRLSQRFQRGINRSNEKDPSSLQVELCLPHTTQLLEASSEGGADRPFSWSRLHRGHQNTPLAASHQQEVRGLATHLSEYTAMQHFTEPDATAHDWSQIAHDLALQVGEREALPVHIPSQAGQAAPRQLLLLPGQWSQLHSPTSERCPVCAVAAFACIALCVRTFEQDKALPPIAAFCQSHHWILAAAIFLRSDNVGRYLSWLEQQRAEQKATLAHAHEYRASQLKRACMACVCVTEKSDEQIAALIEGLRQSTNGSTPPQEELLCLFHWKQTYDACRHESDALALQEQLLHRQQQRLFQLDRAVEAYLARFNAARRERGDVPDIPGADWAWERLLAFFAGEPVLIFPIRTS